MSYGPSSALQAAIYQRLTGDAALAALVGGGIYDSVPPGDTTGTYVAIGAEEVRDASTKTGRGAVHELSVTVVTDEAGFTAAKTVAGAVSDALTGASLVLARGRLVGIWFLRAVARRDGDGTRRRIDLVFRARTED
ncbi:MAG: DUF3168 domain-containing protein [Rhodobacteraceae bacterium]|nr:DUF3168 domain-containing protein [Paracoccaceae bacterium]